MEIRPALPGDEDVFCQGEYLELASNGALSQRFIASFYPTEQLTGLDLMNDSNEEPNIETGTPELEAKDTFRILIMDSVEHVNQLKSACKNAGHSVIPVYTINEAFRFLDGKNHADVIVCAAHLEDESVFEFLKRLKKDPIHKESMFMILSLAPGPVGAQLNDTTNQAGRLLGADAFVSMPVFDAVQLIAEIKKLLPQVPWLERNRRQDEKSRRKTPESGLGS